MKKESKMEELSQLATRAIESAEKYKEETKEKDQLIVMLNRQMEEKKRHLNAAQNKIKMLSQNVVGEMTKQLEMKIKETEVLKEMLKSAKIEIMGKDKQIKRVRAKMAEGSSGSKPRGGRKLTVKKELELSKNEGEEKEIRGHEAKLKSLGGAEQRAAERSEAMPLKTASDKGENYFFKQNLAAVDMEELANMKDLSIGNRGKPGELSNPAVHGSLHEDFSLEEKGKEKRASEISPKSGLSGEISGIQGNQENPENGGSFMGDADK